MDTSASQESNQDLIRLARCYPFLLKMHDLPHPGYMQDLTTLLLLLLYDNDFKYATTVGDASAVGAAYVLFFTVRVRLPGRLLLSCRR
jgi:hypothetical protein